MTLWMRPRRNDETDRAKWPDFSGLGNHGTLNGFTAWDGVTDGWTPYPALKLAGDNDYVEVADDASLRLGTGDFTAEIIALFPIVVSVAGDGLFGKGYASTAPAGGWGFASPPVGTGPVSTIKFLDAYESWAYNANFQFPTLNDGYRHLIVTRISGVYRGYADGVLRIGPVTPAHVADLVHADPVRIGRCNETRYIGTAVPVARLYKGIGLSAAQVTQNYAAGPFGHGYVKDGLVLDLNAAYCVPVLPGLVSRARERATPYTVSFALCAPEAPTTPVSGLAPAVVVSRDGGPFAAATEAATEPGSAGIYAVPLTDDEMDADEVGLVASASGVPGPAAVRQATKGAIWPPCSRH